MTEETKAMVILGVPYLPAMVCGFMADVGVNA